MLQILGIYFELELRSPGPAAFCEQEYSISILASARYTNIKFDDFVATVATSDTPHEDAKILFNIHFGARALWDDSFD